MKIQPMAANRCKIILEGKDETIELDIFDDSVSNRGIPKGSIIIRGKGIMKPESLKHISVVRE